MKMRLSAPVWDFAPSPFDSVTLYMIYDLSYLVLFHDNVFYMFHQILLSLSLSLFMSMNETNAAIVIIALFVRRNTQMKKMQVRSSYVEVLYQITILDTC